MWIYVLLGNVLRGIGETPVQPLGISYIDDYAQSENAALYIGKSTNSLLAALICRSRYEGSLQRYIRMNIVFLYPDRLEGFCPLCC